MPKNIKLIASNTIEDTYANLISMETIPPKHVKCIATDNKTIKIGDGINRYSNLPMEVEGWENITCSNIQLLPVSGDPVSQNRIFRVALTNPSKNLTIGTPIMLATGSDNNETRYFFIVAGISDSLIQCVGEYINPSTNTTDLKVRVGNSDQLVQFDIILPNDLEAEAPITTFNDGLIKNNAKTSFCFRLGCAHIIEVQAHLERAASTTQPKFNVLIGKNSTTKVFPDFEVQETIDADDNPTYIYPNATSTNIINSTTTDIDQEIEVIMPTLGTGDSPAAGLTLSFLAILDKS